ncbi:protein RGF1 INDUCIBLE TRANSCRIPTION FACTOR 1-like [Salvia splendens]|uniref:protein RGF1 INDUCIBLE TRANSCRIPTION FACTOR 1-like n=1 Tax=Salvia splendens TaxID=180675 RepID=UPI001C2748F7|nr:protein RGF1 INDUCIBLE TRANSCRIPTION FACTOR 1-like [Salvia splendens]
MGDIEDDDGSKWPPWLRPLLQSSFFGQCKVHAAAAHKSECNMFCLDCIDGPICSLCLNFHKDHRHIQIRRSSYHDVIRVGEIQKYLDIAGVQTYIINSAKIVFLNQRRRPQPRPGKGSATNTCCVCDRSLLDSFDFCSIGCKIVGTSKNFDKEKMRTDDGGASDSDESFESVNAASIRKQVVRIKVQGFTPSTPPQTAASKRRKGVPRRAPTGGLLLGY